jgi:AcrR family transcriptional regulator
MAERRKTTKRRVRAAGAAAGTATTSAGPRTVDRDAVIAVAMDLFAGRGWMHTSLADIAVAADVSFADLYPVFPSKTAIMRGFTAAIDRKVLAAAPESGASIREGLFELFMRRFDALQPQRKALERLAQDLPRDPAAAAAIGMRGCRSIAAMAELAGVDTSGLGGALRVKALVALYAWVMRTWLGDDSTDMARTMKVLDQGLERLEVVARSLPGTGQRAAA